MIIDHFVRIVISNEYHGTHAFVRVWADGVLDELRALLPALCTGTALRIQVGRYSTDDWFYFKAERPNESR